MKTREEQLFGKLREATAALRTALDERDALRENDAAAVEAVTERRKADDARRVAELRHRGDEADALGRGVEVACEQRQHRLVVIERRGCKPRPRCQQYDDAT